MSAGRLAAVLALAASSLLLALGWLRAAPDRIWGDEGTYLAMAGSLAHDRDLWFREEDLERERRVHPPGPADVILEKTERGIAYSKPILFPLLAAPLVALAGDAGAVAFNFLALGAALALAWRGLGRLGGRGPAALTLVTFAFTGVVLPYALWRMSEALEVALVLAGLVLASAWGEGTGEGTGGRTGGRTGGASVGGILLGMAGSLRVPNLVLAMAPLGLALWRRQWRRAIAVGGGTALGYAAVALLTWGLTGAANPYKAARSGFNQETGYPVGPDAARALARFETDLGTSSLEARPDSEPRVVAYAALYFLAGRHSGLALYFPAALLFAWLGLRHGGARGRLLVGAAAALALFYLVWLPRNYMGGATFLGNRYFLPAYPALLLALGRLPSPRALLAVWLVAGVAGGSAFDSVRRARALDPMSQSHGYAGIFRLLPYESVVPDLDGRRDRYWQGDFLRFVDPWAEVGEEDFRLSSWLAPAELLIARRPGAGQLSFAVESEEPEILLTAADWRGSAVALLRGDADGCRGVVEVRPALAWRRHPFWWARGVDYDAVSLRLSVSTRDGRPARARLRYLGSPPA